MAQYSQEAFPQQIYATCLKWKPFAIIVLQTLYESTERLHCTFFKRENKIMRKWFEFTSMQILTQSSIFYLSDGALHEACVYLCAPYLHFPGLKMKTQLCFSCCRRYSAQNGDDNKWQETTFWDITSISCVFVIAVCVYLCKTVTSIIIESTDAVCWENQKLWWNGTMIFATAWNWWGETNNVTMILKLSTWQQIQKQS